MKLIKFTKAFLIFSCAGIFTSPPLFARERPEALPESRPIAEIKQKVENVEQSFSQKVVSLIKQAESVSNDLPGKHKGWVEKLLPYGQSKDARMELNGNRGRPDDKPEPGPKPSPTPPVPVPLPDPVPIPAPEPTPAPEPEPIPAPVSDPVLDPAPTPDPEPSPDPTDPPPRVD